MEWGKKNQKNTKLGPVSKHHFFLGLPDVARERERQREGIAGENSNICEIEIGGLFFGIIPVERRPILRTNPFVYGVRRLMSASFFNICTQIFLLLYILIYHIPFLPIF